MREFVLLLGHVVGLKRGCSDLDRVREDLLTLLDLLGLVDDGFLFVLDLSDGVTRLRGIEDDTGTELRLSEGLKGYSKSEG
jgi:hypothetical protein